VELSEDAVRQRLARGRKILREQVLAFVEGALKRSNPGKAFTVAVVASLPALAVSTHAATIGATTKTVGAASLLHALLGNEMGILGMQADQNFDSALNLDPSNWEAQFFKAAAMSHWPLELNKGDEVIQRLSNLIDHQDTQLPRPEFAQSHVVLGDQYLKMGQPDHAAATWQIGARMFPGHPELQRKIPGN
jgi:hypothetical protein